MGLAEEQTRECNRLITECFEIQSYAMSVEECAVALCAELIALSCKVRFGDLSAEEFYRIADERLIGLEKLRDLSERIV